MRVEIAPFTPAHADDAAALLAARHRADRAHAPELSPAFETPATARQMVLGALGQRDATGVAAVRGGRMTGFLIGAVELTPPASVEALVMRPRSARILYHGHAIDPDDDGETYRAMYAALAPHWLAAGCFAHYVTAPATDRRGLTAWFSLGFGQESIRGVRATAPGGAPPGPTYAGRSTPALSIRRAGPDDLDVVTMLDEELGRFHARPPIYLPFLPETADDGRRLTRESLSNPTQTCWLAYRDATVVGMQVYQTRSSDADMTIPERGIHLAHGYTSGGERGGGVGATLLAHALARADDSGYEHCTVSWFSTNLLAHRFWPRAGFRPVAYRMLRIVDERIAWAGPTASPL